MSAAACAPSAARLPARASAPATSHFRVIPCIVSLPVFCHCFPLRPRAGADTRERTIGAAREECLKARLVSRWRGRPRQRSATGGRAGARRDSAENETDAGEVVL